MYTRLEMSSAYAGEIPSRQAGRQASGIMDVGFRREVSCSKKNVPA